MTTKYKEGESILLYHPLWWHTQGIQETATNYGRKLTTPYKVEHNGRLYRVYCRCFRSRYCYSNVLLLYILPGGKPLYLRDTSTTVLLMSDDDSKGVFRWLNL